MQLLSSLYKFVFSGKLVFLKIILTFFVIGNIFHPFGVLASTTSPTVTTNSTATATVASANGNNVNGSSSVKIGVAIIKIIASILGLMTFLVGLFLYPEWTSGTIVGLGGNDGALKQMWIMVSNVVYFIFALIFIWIAFMNIIGKDDGYQLKEALPRFIIGVLMVPFTWFFVQLIISISGILTVGVLSLPYDTFKDTYMKSETLQKVELCTAYTIYAGSAPGGTFPITCDPNKPKITLNEILNPQNSESLFGITAIYTYGVMSLESQAKLFQEDLSITEINDLLNLGLKVILDVIFLVIYGLLMIALAMALFMRGVYLWLYAMASPIFGLMYFFKKESEGIMDSKLSITEFISLAFVPVYVSAALAFGLLFLFSAGASMTQQSHILDTAGKTITFGGFSYTLEGPPPVDGGVKSKIMKLIEGFQGTFGTLLLQVFGIAILWMTIMAALNKSKITQVAAAPFQDIGKKVGDMAMRAPTMLPIIPDMKGGFMNMNTLQQGVSQFSTAVTTKGQAEGSDMGRRWATDMGFVVDKVMSKLTDLNNKPYNSAADVKNGVLEALAVIPKDRLNEGPIKQQLVDIFKKTGASSELQGKIQNGTLTDDRLGKILFDHRNTGWTGSNSNELRQFLSTKQTAGEIEALIGNGSVNMGTQKAPVLPNTIMGKSGGTAGEFTLKTANNTNVDIKIVGGKVFEGKSGQQNLTNTQSIDYLVDALRDTYTKDGENGVQNIFNTIGLTNDTEKTDIMRKIKQKP